MAKKKPVNGTASVPVIPSRIVTLATPATGSTPTSADIYATEVARLASLISDPGRVKVLMLVAEGNRNVGELAEASGSSQPVVSHRLMLLRTSQMIRPRRVKKANFYELTDDGRKLLAAAEVLGRTSD